MLTDKTIVTGPNGEQAYYRQKSQHTWVLVAEGSPNRARWGNWREIEQDVEHFKTYGTLPPPLSAPW